jgi:Flp pilus assembly protein TadG
MKLRFCSPKSSRSEKGQALLEITLIFPFLVLLLYGTIEVANVISVYQTMTHTTREGANLISRGTVPNTALNAIITAAAPTIQNTNQGQWKIIYSQITQKPGIPCPPPAPCTYEVSNQIVRGNLGQSTQIGPVGATVTIPGVQDVAAGQTFDAIEAYFDYGPNVITFVGNNINKLFYDRTIFTRVSN